jgi:LuxR family maltose regulon positive regulatory protein
MVHDIAAGRANGKAPHGRLLLTKLRAPRAASDGVVRERLMREIDRGVEGKLTLIVTPPGYGKSTLVSQWHTQTERASAWLSLDNTDNDISVFLEYMVAAIRSIDASMCPDSAALLRASARPPARQLISLLINEIAESTRPFVLILDDFHAITSEEVQESVILLLQLMPATMSVVLTSRKEPDLPTLRMNARGELVELGPVDLCFSPEETREFLIERQQLDLRRSEVDEIERWAEGWPVALRLVAGALRGRSAERVRSLLDALTENVPQVSDYLWDEAIENQPPDRRDFLLRTAILQQINPDVAEAVTGNPRAGDLLNNLSRDNLFISRLYGPGSWYRFHHIFADVLRQRLARAVDDDVVRQMHARAAEWYVAHQLTTEAAHHAIQARSWPLAAELLVTICKEFYDQERVGTLHAWLRDLPDEPLLLEPRLAYWLAWAQVRTGHALEAHRPMRLAEQATSTGAMPANVLSAALQLRLLEALFAWDLESGEAAAATLLERLGPDDGTDQSRTLIMLGMLREIAGMFPEAERALEQARTLNGRLGIRGLQVAALSATAIVQLSAGKLREPADMLRRVVAIADEWNDLPLQNAHQRLGGIYYEWNQLDEAMAHADRTGELARRMDAPFHLAQVPALRARISAANGEWDRAFDEIEQSIAASDAAGYSGIVPVFEEMRCRMWLRTDQLMMAQGWLQHIGLDLIGSKRYQDLPRTLTALRIRLRDGRAGEIICPLDELKTLATERGWNRALLTIQVLRAMAESECGNRERAQAALAGALELGAAEGFVRSFLDEGPGVIPLLRQAAVTPGIHQAYATTLLEAAGEAVAKPGGPPSPEPGILSPRERDVMRLVASGLSNRDVGDALFISEETVKTHMRRIFEKLEVSSRTQAINRSQQLGLI